MQKSSTIIDRFLARVETTPNAPALIFAANEWTVSYRQLFDRARAAAEQLRLHGAGPGKAVALLADRSPEFFTALWGTWFCGATAAVFSPVMATAEQQWAVDLCAPVCSVGHCAAFAELPSLAFANSPAIQNINHSKPDEPALIMFTSGTTGRPKGVEISHRAVLASLENTYRHFPFEQGAIVLSFLPHSHAHGLLMTTMLPLLFGGAAVIDQAFDAFSAPRVWELIGRWQVNHFSSVPSILKLLAGFYPRLENVHHDSLRFAFCASAPLDPTLRHWWFEKVNCPIANNYGLTEATSWVAHGELSPDAPGDSVGLTDPAVIEIVDKQGKTLPIGETGEVTVRGPQLMSGYLHDPQQTAEALREGRLHTGDLGYLDENRRLYLLGRIKEIIIVGGENVSPTEVESAVAVLPGVNEAAAFAFPDKHYGEVVAVAVTCGGEAPTLAQVRQSLEGILSPFKLPRKLFVVNELPKNALGKLKRAELSRRFTPAD